MAFKEYISIITLIVFVLATLLNCIFLVQATGDIIYLVLFVIPFPIIIIVIYVGIFKIRKKS